MAEIDQSYEEHDMSENPENPQSEIPETENSDPDEDNSESENESQPENEPQPEEKQEHNDTTTLGGGENKWSGWPGESVFRLLVPSQKVGGIIGRKGEFIKKMCEETGARIKILDGPPGIAERAVLVSAKEEPDSPVPPAVDALLKVLKRAVDGLDSDAPPVMGAKVSTRLMAPAAQAGSLIGKQGSTIKSIQEASGCIVRVTEDLPLFALKEDRIVEVVGEPAGVQKAVELIASHLRRFLVDRSVVPMFETQMQMPNPQMEQHMPPQQSWGPPPPQAFPPNVGGGPQGYGGNPHYMPPPRQVDNYYPHPEMAPPMEKQPHHGISAYGREAPPSMHAQSQSQSQSQSNAHPTQSMITQVTQQMQIPLSYADAVIGSGGSSISYIRRASGATVAIQETRGVPTEMTVEISGTASQVQTAQQLIQNSMAEAAAGSAQAQAQAQTAVPPTDQSYNPYAAQHGSLYDAPPSTAAQTGAYAQATGAYGEVTGYGQASAAYSSVYGGNYGY